MLVEINAPSEFQSAVHSLVIKRLGIVSAIDPREDWFTMMAEVNRFSRKSNENADLFAFVDSFE